MGSGASPGELLQRHGRDQEIIDVDLEGERAAGCKALPKEERITNAAAAEFCVPAATLESFLRHEHPFDEKKVVAFARLLNRHPGLVVGQIQSRLGRSRSLNRYLVKIRPFVLPATQVDGRGQAIPLSL